MSEGSVFVGVVKQAHGHNGDYNVDDKNILLNINSFIPRVGRRPTAVFIIHPPLH